MNRWIPEPDVQDCDTTAPEAMAGTMYSRRFTSSDQIDGMWGVVTVQFYCDDQWQSSGQDLKQEDSGQWEPVEPAERYRIGQIVEFIRCTDPEMPGDTAEDSPEYSYKYSWFLSGAKFTDEQIKALAEHFKAEWILWDGLGVAIIDGFAQIQPVEAEAWDELILTEELKDWVFLYALFRDVVCHDCKLGADAHTVGPGPLGHRHAWCRIADPAFALEVLRARVDLADTTKAANGFSDEDQRAEQFEAALYALDEAGVLTERIEFILGSRNRANYNDDEGTRAEARITLGRNLAAAQQQITNKEA